MSAREESVPALCRDCLSRLPADGAEEHCPKCGSARLLRHPELDGLRLAHVDCDAFYATVEKRDNPALADKPVIVGGGRRGVAMTACYIARRYGVHSAMPMFKALKLCPEAVVIRPRMDHYAEVSRHVRAIFLDATPLVEPVSLDEAYLDLSGTESLHRHSPAVTLADRAPPPLWRAWEPPGGSGARPRRARGDARPRRQDGLGRDDVRRRSRRRGGAASRAVAALREGGAAAQARRARGPDGRAQAEDGLVPDPDAAAPGEFAHAAGRRSLWRRRAAAGSRGRPQGEPALSPDRRRHG